MSDRTVSLPREAHREALRIAGVYAVAAAAWIVVSDLLLGPEVPALETRTDLAKGLVFVLVTSTAIYLWARRQARNRTRLSHRYTSLAEQAPDLVYRVRLRPELSFEYVSAAAEEILGHTPEELYADPTGLLDAIHPADRHRLETLLADPDATREPTELRWRHRDGSLVWTENRFTALRDEDGTLIGAQSIARDITRRKEAQRRNELLATAVEAAGEAVMITDRDGRIEYVNPAFTEIAGYTADEIVGRTPRVLKSGRQPESFYEELWNTVSAGRTFRGEMVNRRSDGRLYDQECAITPVTDGEGRVIHYVAVARDVTVQREMEERVRIAGKMQAVGQLAAGVAHDFRNVLNVIQINARALRGRTTGERGVRTVLSEEDASRIREVCDAADRGAALVGKLLTVGRRDELNLVATDLAATVERLRTTFRALLPETVTLVLDIDPDLPRVQADGTALEQILLNLVTNARDALSDGGRVRVEVEEARRTTAGAEPRDGRIHHGRYVRVAVEDSGAGMDGDTLRRVFEPFFTTKPEGRGTGLGLATVRSLVERHGGIVSVRSRPGEGTAFEFFLPVAPETTSAEASATDDVAEARPPLPQGSETILLVEDDEALRAAGVRALANLGYRVSAAQDGEEALEWLSRRARDVDLVVTDLVMPRMDGVTLFERSRERGWPLPFLFMSGYGSGDMSWHPNPDRLRIILEKPWTVEDLAHRVRQALDD